MIRRNWMTVKRLLLCGASAIVMAPVTGAAPALANPAGGTVVGGAATISENGKTLTVTQGTDRAVINWRGFSIDADETTRFVQPDAGSIAANRVTGADPSRILGRMEANGRVVLINPNGVLFAKGTTVDVAGLVATTHDFDTAAFMAGGTVRFNGEGAAGASVVNEGTIAVSDAGLAALVAPHVRNSGTIAARVGQVALASGRGFSLDLYGDGLLSFAPGDALAETLADADGTPIKALVEQAGEIFADGGRVLLAATAARDVVNHSVNVSGIVRAASANDAGGVIRLSGSGTVEVEEGALISVSGDRAGAVEVTGGDVVLAGSVEASARGGGENGGTIFVLGDMAGGSVDLAGRLAAGTTDAGGFIETSAAKVNIADSARVSTLSADGAAGIWLIDPDDYTIAASGGDITGATLSVQLADGNIAIETNGAGTSGNGDIFVDDEVTWSTNTLTLTADRNIFINSRMDASGGGNLTLEYARTDAGGDVFVNAPVDLAAGSAFTTREGADAAVAWTVVTDLGTEGNTSAADLQGMSGGLAGNYVLGADIDAAATAGWNAGEGFMPVGDLTTPFTGRFDGLGHTITGLTIDRSMTGVGLFGRLSGARVSNVGLIDPGVRGESYYTGSLAGSAIASTRISNAYATGSVAGTGSYVSGLIGHAGGDSSIENSYATGDVTGGAGRVGGLLGGGLSGIVIKDAYATGNVIGAGSSVGGLVGYTAFSGNVITRAFSTGNVIGSGHSVGGLVGRVHVTTISDAYATGDVTGNVAGTFPYGYVGGLVGHLNASSSIDSAFATGRVTGSGSFVGGLANVMSPSASVSNSYWDMDATGRVTGGAGITDGALTTVEAMQAGSYAGWDIDAEFGTDTAWRVYEGQSYPSLRSFLTPVAVVANSGSRVYDGTTDGLGATYSTLDGSILDPALLLGRDSVIASKNVGTAYAVTGDELYSSAYDIDYTGGTLDVTAATISAVTGIAAADKTYDRTTAATLDAGGAGFTGMIAGDTLTVATATGAFAEETVGNDKTVTITGITLGGADAANYVLAGDTAIATADIAPSLLLARDVTSERAIKVRLSQVGREVPSVPGGVPFDAAALTVTYSFPRLASADTAGKLDAVDTEGGLAQASRTLVRELEDMEPGGRGLLRSIAAAFADRAPDRLVYRDMAPRVNVGRNYYVGNAGRFVPGADDDGRNPASR